MNPGSTSCPGGSSWPPQVPQVPSSAPSPIHGCCEELRAAPGVAAAWHTQSS